MKKLLLLCMICFMQFHFGACATFPVSAATGPAEEYERDCSPDAYRRIYRDKIADTPEDMELSLIYLDDDDIPELVVYDSYYEEYSIYTVKDGVLFCFVDAMRTVDMEYYVRSGVIEAFARWKGGGDTGGYGSYCYQVSKNNTLAYDSSPVLYFEYNAIYDENNNYTGRGEVTYSYLGQETDEENFEKARRKMGIVDKELEPVCAGYGIGRKGAIGLLGGFGSTGDASDSVGASQSAYRGIYKKKLEEMKDDIGFSFIYLDDDDIPELVIRADKSEVSSYFVYTVKDGALFCLADSIKAEGLLYCERCGLLGTYFGWRGNCVESKNSYYSVSTNRTLKDGVRPLLERSNDIRYDEKGNYVDVEEDAHYFYLGQEIDEDAYEKICKKLGIREECEKGMGRAGQIEREIVLELLK